MLAPEPFFEPRGTPFSEYHRIKALGELGHHVDLVTYPIGRDVPLPNLQIFRTFRPPFVRTVRIGPSVTKIVLDGLMLFTILRRVLTTSYDAVHSHEEMGLVGVWLARALGVPHLYDMHSSLPQQLSNFKYSRSSALRRVFGWGTRGFPFLGFAWGTKFWLKPSGARRSSSSSGIGAQISRSKTSKVEKSRSPRKTTALPWTPPRCPAMSA
jgi:hypothetical protein